MHLEIDGLNIHSAADAHKVLAEAFDFGPYYGHNLDALFLSTEVARPTEVIWHHAGASRAAIGEEAFNGLIRVLRRAEDEDRTKNPPKPIHADPARLTEQAGPPNHRHPAKNNHQIARADADPLRASEASPKSPERAAPLRTSASQEGWRGFGWSEAPPLGSGQQQRICC
ncbi:barstar family protein [Dactylosporangium salmoneum]|uniref:Barstar (barnase inhibitor) domain-containing protein n=1 Tax=Dactylosporangium salmoneum TaxID=53361 RepID=A0ABN3HRH0_9ACTN